MFMELYEKRESEVERETGESNNSHGYGARAGAGQTNYY
jgi:hypothetical protein